MRFFLTLVLLGGTVFKFPDVLSQELYGEGSGQYFFLGDETGENSIEGIRISTGLLGLFKSMELKINNNWTDKKGIPGGLVKEINFWKGEFVTKIMGTHRLCIKYMKIFTNKGREFEFGIPDGHRFSAYPPQEGMVLKAIKGLTGLICIRRIGFDWKSIPAQEDTTLETNTPTKLPTTKIQTTNNPTSDYSESSTTGNNTEGK